MLRPACLVGVIGLIGVIGLAAGCSSSTSARPDAGIGGAASGGRGGAGTGGAASGGHGGSSPSDGGDGPSTPVDASGLDVFIDPGTALCPTSGDIQPGTAASPLPDGVEVVSR